MSPAHSRLDRSAHAFSIQFPTLKKFEYLVCGQRIFAECENYLAIRRLHRETNSYSVLPQYVDGLHNIVCSVCVIAHDSSPKTIIIAETEEPV